MSTVGHRIGIGSEHESPSQPIVKQQFGKTMKNQIGVQGGWRLQKSSIEVQSDLMLHKNWIEVPSGLMLHQPSLLRGSGRLVPKTCLYDKQFRRFTLERIHAGITAGNVFMVEGGVRGAFVSTWVMPNNYFAAFNQRSMALYLNLMFATDVARAHELFPKTSDDALDLGKLRQLMGDYAIVGKTTDGQLQYLHRDGIIYGITEHTEFISTTLGVDLELLHGTTRPRTGSRLSARTESARTSARSMLLGPPSEPVRVREVHDNSGIADAAFPATPTRESPEIDIDDLPPPAVELDLFGSDSGHTDVHPSPADESVEHSDQAQALDDWVQCDRCHAWRHPPPRTFQKLLNSEAIFSCSMVGARCRTLNSRRVC